MVRFIKNSQPNCCAHNSPRGRAKMLLLQMAIDMKDMYEAGIPKGKMLISGENDVIENTQKVMGGKRSKLAISRAGTLPSNSSH